MKKFFALIAIAAVAVLGSCAKQDQNTDTGSPKLNKTDIKLMVGDKETLKVENVAATVAISFKSEDTKIATVNSKSGQVTAKAPGSTVIVAKAGEAELKCNVTVIPKENIVTSLEINSEDFSLNEGGTKQLSASAKPDDATDREEAMKTLTWSSSDESVATVSSTGLVTAKTVAEGETKSATITAKVISKEREIKATVKVTVSSSVVKTTGIQLNQTSVKLNPGETATLTPTLTPANHTDSPTVSWESDNTSVATVSGGVVTAKDYGSATITAKISDAIKATCTVTVQDGPKAGVTIDMSNTYFEHTWPSSVASMENVTLECWVMLSQNSSGGNTAQSFLGTEGVFLIREQAGSFQAVTGGGSASGWTQATESVISTPSASGEWHHVAATYSSSDKAFILYVDGVAAATGASKLDGALPMNGIEGYTDNTNPNIFMVGNAYGRNRFLNGNIAYARVWNVVRTQEQIAANMAKKTPSGNGLVANWYFTDGQGNSIKDYSGNNANLSPKEGNISWVSATLPSVE